MNDRDKESSRMLLHACCGPCSLEPVRTLTERGIIPDIYYANSNIAPASEYERRRNTIATWADSEGLHLVEGPYEPKRWFAAVAPHTNGPTVHDDERRDRCRMCYRVRFEETARFAKTAGYDVLGTTLSVSPYQFTDIIKEELERACKTAGLCALFEDYRPLYSEATRRSRAAGMYRQDYCGCAWSKAEAEMQRAERKAHREAERALRQQTREAQEAALEARREERRAYDEKRARQRATLKALRQERRIHENR